MDAVDRERSTRWLSLIIRRPAFGLLPQFLSCCVLIRLCKVAAPWVASTESSGFGIQLLRNCDSRE
jgi:hypothetical protein